VALLPEGADSDVELARLYQNFFQPVIKLASKTRVGGKIHRVYDEPRTPYQRLVESGQITRKTARELRAIYESLNPAELHRRLQDLSVLTAHRQAADDCRRNHPPRTEVRRGRLENYAKWGLAETAMPSTNCGENVLGNGIGSPGRTRFELLQPNGRSARTSPIAFGPMAYAQNWQAHPDWVPSRDPSRTGDHDHHRVENLADRFHDIGSRIS